MEKAHLKFHLEGALKDLIDFRLKWLKKKDSLCQIHLSLLENKMIFKRKKVGGFTLIEVLITMLILGVVLMALITCFIYGFNVLTRTRQTAIAAQCVQKELEAIRNMSFSQVSALGTSWTHQSLAKLENAQGALSVQDSGLGNDIKKLTVSVTWTYRRRNMRDEIVTYITRDGINKK